MAGTTRTLGPLAQQQLEMWEKIADHWILVPRWRTERSSSTAPIPMSQLHFVCPNCDSSVFAASEQSITPATIKAATVAHVRNRHRELDPDA
jgi:hypothetical protein